MEEKLFNLETVFEEIKKALLTKIEARNKTASALDAAKAVRIEETRKEIAQLESDIEAVDSSLVDSLAGSKDTADLTSRKAALKKRIEDLRGKLSDHGRVKIFADTAAAAQRELTLAAGIEVRSMAVNFAKAASVLVEQLGSMLKSWDDLHRQVSSVVGDGLLKAWKIPFDQTSLSVAEMRDFVGLFKDLAERLEGCASARNFSGTPQPSYDPRQMATQGQIDMIHTAASKKGIQVFA